MDNNVESLDSQHSVVVLEGTECPPVSRPVHQPIQCGASADDCPPSPTMVTTCRAFGNIEIRELINILDPQPVTVYFMVM